MDAQKVDMYILQNQKYLPAEQMLFIRDKLMAMDDSKFIMLNAVELRDPTIMLIVSIFLGSLGIDRFMLGDIGLGVLKLLTCGVCGILSIIDWFTVMRRTKELNFNNLMMVLSR